MQKNCATLLKFEIRHIIKVTRNFICFGFCRVSHWSSMVYIGNKQLEQLVRCCEVILESNLVTSSVREATKFVGFNFWNSTLLTLSHVFGFLWNVTFSQLLMIIWACASIIIVYQGTKAAPTFAYTKLMDWKSIILTVHDLGSGKQAYFSWTATKVYGYP
jgi:hypothetical protein